MIARGMTTAPGGYAVRQEPSFEEFLYGIVRADYVGECIDLDEFERRVEWVFRNPDRWPDWAGRPHVPAFRTEVCER